jgi:hypothetical protein
VEAIKRKNEILRGKSGRHTPISSSKQTPPQARQNMPKNPKGPPSPATPQGGQALKRQPTKHTEEEHTEAPVTARGNRPLPIKITLQDPKDTVTLIEKTSNIKHFHIKRIHTSKHVLYLQNLKDYNNAKETLLAANLLSTRIHQKKKNIIHIC